MKHNDYSLPKDLHHSSIDYAHLPEAIAESKHELQELEADMEHSDGAVYSNLRKQRSRLVISIMKLERKLVDKKKAAKKATAEWINGGSMAVGGAG